MARYINQNTNLKRKFQDNVFIQYIEQVDIMPELEQIRHYFKNLRNRLGDNNNIEEIKKFISTLEYKPGETEDDELFVFGTQLGMYTE